MENKPELESGVSYKSSDYAGLWRRVAIAFIDIAFLFLLFFIMANLWFSLNPESESLPDNSLWFAFLASYLYLGVLKASRFRTLGYIMAGVRIVDLKGCKPSWFKMFFRYVLMIAGPVDLILDIIWLTGEETRQTFRDKYVGTYVINKTAQPISQGPIVKKEMNVMGLHLLFPEVRNEY